MRDLDRIREVREYRVTGPQLASLLGLIAVLVGAGFVLGLQVGLLRQPVDEQLLSPSSSNGERDSSAVLADLLAEHDRSSSARGGGDPASPDPSPTGGLSAAQVRDLLDDEERTPELVALDDTRAADPTPDPTPAPTPEPTPDPTPEPTPDPTPEPTPDSTPEPTPEPTPTPTPAPTPLAEVERARPEGAGDALPGPPSGAGWTVQLAAYPSEAEAAELIRDLRGRGFAAFHQRADVNGQTWHRVRVDLHADKASAEAAARTLASASPYDPFVTRHP